MEKTKRRISWLAALCVLSVLAVAAVGIAWSVNADKQNAEAQKLRDGLENGYRQSYYQLCYNIGNMSTYLNKLSVAASPTMQMQLLGQISAESASAGAAVNHLLTADDNADKTTKYINQVGDYCLRLQYALARGGSLTGEDKDNLLALYTVITQIETQLNALKQAVEEGDFSFLARTEGTDTLGELVQKLEGETVAYPALIYDGPFSDAIDNATPIGLSGEEVTQRQAERRIATYLPTQSQITYLGELGGDIAAYRFAAQTRYGTYYLDITKQGGMLLHLSCDARPTDTVYTAEQCADYGLGYLQSIGLNDMQAVWVSNYNSVYYINYAYCQDDTVCYSDLVVLQVDASDMTLVGVEARNYWYNHRVRTLPAPTVAARQAADGVSANLQQDGLRLALIPTDGGGELLTYEVSGTRGDDRYFVYVDAATGQEYKILRVIDSDQGQLLL